MNKLTPEIVSLIHHIKLHETGWREKAIQSLIISTIGNKGNFQVSKEEVFRILTTEINNSIDKNIFNKQVDLLLNNRSLVPLGKDLFILSSEKYKEYQDQFEKQSYVDTSTYNLFLKICNRHLPTLPAGEVWDDFIENLLLPVIKQIGAKTYEWISGKYKFNINDYPQHQSFINKYGELGPQLSKAIFEFLDFQNEYVKQYILSQRDAYFFVQATSLETKDVEAIYKNSKAQTNLKIFVDTNFLLTLLDLHDNPSNEATYSLLDLVKEVKDKVRIKFYILPITVNELQNLLGKFKEYLSKIRPSLNYAIAVEGSNEFSGILKKYFERCVKQKSMINLDDYFDPYLNNFTVTIRGKGLELFNMNLNSYNTKQAVIDDIIDQTQYRINRLKEAKSLKTLSSNEIEFEEIRIEDKFKHDCILWHLTKDRRPTFIDSPKDVMDWVVTLDYGFLAFDRYKQKSLSRSNVNVCLHPNELVAMLQFWVPRTKAFENAILGNFRLPFLFKETDVEGEKVSIEILKAVSYYEGSEDFSSDQITEILTNNAIRQKIKPSNTVETNADLIKEEVFKKYEESQVKLKQKEVENSDLKDQIILVNNTIESLSSTLNKLAIEVKKKAEQDLIDYQENKKNELYAQKRELEKQIQNLQIRYSDFENLRKRADAEIAEKTNKILFKTKALFYGEEWENNFRLSIVEKYLDIEILGKISQEISTLQNKLLEKTLNPVSNEKIVIICEGNNAIFFNKLGFEKLHFQGVKNSNAVFINTVANPTYFGIRDRDYLSDLEISKIRAVYPNYIILNYYCYENYLYHPQNIEELKLPNLDINFYIKDMVKQKNEKKDLIISSKLKSSRSSYQEFNSPKDADRFKDKDELTIVNYLRSDDVEIFLKSYNLKSDAKLFDRHLLQKYNLNETILTSTNWFKTRIGEIISIK